jgi:iron uptake system component EfeO
LNITHSHARRALAATILGSALIAFAGCGDDDDSGEDSAQSTSTSAETAAVDQAKLDAAVQEYDAFVERNAADLVDGTAQFVAAVDAGDIDRAKAVYTSARAPFERIEPVAGAFGDLDPDIDGREGDIPAEDWGGYHRIEKALWIEESTKGLAPVTEELVSDVANLEDIAEKADFDPAEMAQGAVDLLGEVSASKITGEEERYSRTDLWDFEANVDGALAAFEALEPAISQVDPELAEEIATQFDETYATLDEYRRGDGFVYYYELSTDDTAKLSQRIDALAEPLSQVAAIVG